MAETLVLLHGFAGTHHGWDDVVARLDGQRYRPLALDLRGHGGARDRRPVGFAECVADVLDAAPDRFALAGYSLGGRVALHVTLAAPERVSRLILVSTTAGIEDAAARAARRAQDEALAARLEAEDDIAAFARRWTSGPLFAADPPHARAAARHDILRNEPAALAAVMRGLGTGVMEPLWDRLTALAMPATVLAGSKDAKFVALGRRLEDCLPNAAMSLVEPHGHALTRVAPAAVAAALDACRCL